MLITFFLRKEGKKEWLKIELKLKGKNNQKLRVSRAIEIPKTKLQEFKHFLKGKLNHLEGKLNQEELKTLFAKLYKEFAGKPLPQRKKAKKQTQPFNPDFSNPDAFSTIASLYLDYVKATKQPKTYITRLEELKQLAKFFGNLSIQQITQQQLIQYQLWRKSQRTKHRKTKQNYRFTNLGLKR